MYVVAEENGSIFPKLNEACTPITLSSKLPSDRQYPPAKNGISGFLSVEMIGSKYHVSLPLAAGAVFIAVPYSISLLTQWVYGWPNYPGYRKYVEALKPRRIYYLTRAVLETLKYLQYGKLYFQWKSWYNNVDNHKHYEKGITFGRHGNKLDLYYSPTRDQAGMTPSSVVVFIYGGAWGSGERCTYCLLALQMAKELSAAVVCPDYSTHPKGNVLNMVQDVADCLVWLKENGHMFNIDTKSIVMIGHSAGAHLCALTTLFLVDGVDELAIEAETQREITSSIKGVIGLSGVYDVMDHYQHEKMRGVEYVSTMHKAMGGMEKFDYYSPRTFLKKLTEDAVERVPPFGLLHGMDDIIVPVESSVCFSEALTSRSAKASLYLLPKLGHTEIVTDLMAPDRRFYHTVFGCIKQEFSKFIV
ncbi:putative isoprenylcysteine alpha-carbonyl methylesterase ICMEL2 [Arapaima gigas]